MDQFKAIFDFSKPVQMLDFPTPASRKNVPSTSSSISAASSTQSLFRLESGTNYAKKYIKAEERQLLEQSKKYATINGRFDEVSIGTMRTGMSDVTDVDIEKIYRTYKFEHRTKQNLPINVMRDKIVSMIDTNSAVVIEGPTGCGKTTQVPQFILDNCYKKKVHCNIIVTQPRRIAATSIAKRVAQERDWPLGTLVGYKVGMLNKTSRDTRLTYCTTGVLLRHLINNKNMLEFTHIILDEVHERDQEMDFLLLVVRKLLRSNSRSVKVILMSATIDVDKFAKYFSTPINGKMSPAPIIDISKSHAFEIDKYYLCQLGNLGKIPKVEFEDPRVTMEMMEFCTKLVNVFDEVDEDGHRHVVLIFLPGIWELEEMHQTLTNFAETKDAKWDIVVLHSTITNEEQQVIFELPPQGFRRIILSTNIAESSITVPDVRYVIDFCLAKILTTNRETNFQCLETCWASKTNCEQRAGRTGRTMNGRVYRLVPRFFYNEHLIDESPPEIQRAPLEHIILNAKLLDMGSPMQLLALAIDPPDLSNLESTILLLKEVGALLDQKDRHDGQLTGLGKMMARLPVSIHVAKLIALGHAFGILRSAIIIGASMSTKSVFSNPFQKKLQAYSMKLNWSQGSSSDCIAFLNVYNLWQAEKANRRINSKQSEKAWAQKNFVQIRVLYEIHTLIQELMLRLKYSGIVIQTGSDNFDDPRDRNEGYGFILKTVIAGAFYPNYFYNANIQDIAECESMKTVPGLDPNRTVFLKGWPVNQPGPLYTKHLQRVFQGCCGIKETTKTRVSFDSTNRVYVTFSADETRLKHVNDPVDFIVPGKVSNSVYRALKMRDSNREIVIPLMRAGEANKLATALNIPKTVDMIPFAEDDFEMDKEAFNKFRNKDEEPVYFYKRPILPGLKTVQIPVMITEIIDPYHFWIRSRNDDAYYQYLEINSEIQDNSKLVPLNHKPANGELVIVSINDNGKVCNQRAVVHSTVTENGKEKVSVLFVDYGKVHECLISDLRQFHEPNEVMEIPSLALECTLMGIKAAQSDATSISESRNAFLKILRQSKCFAEIYSVVNSVLSIKLHCDMPNQQRININDWLIDENFAEQRDEDFLSQKNHEVRTEVGKLDEKQVKFYEKYQYDQSDILFRIPEITESQAHISAILKGPFSPLEMVLSSLLVKGKGKSVKISSLSVNSVLMNTDVGSDHNSLVVAGLVHQSAAGTALHIDATTLMPNILGLTSLIALIFAPQIELRRNKLGNRYSSALCGLGYDETYHCSAFPEHDMEIGFDVEIDNKDLIMINKLRNFMSAILINSDNEDSDPQEIANIQEKVRESFMMIFEKERKPQKIEFTVHTGKWKQVDETLILKSKVDDQLKSNIYRLHRALDLNSLDPEFEEMAEHFDELQVLLREDPRKFNEEIVCKFCDQTVFGIFGLRNHITQASHDINVRKFGLCL